MIIKQLSEPEFEVFKIIVSIISIFVPYFFNMINELHNNIKNMKENNWLNLGKIIHKNDTFEKVLYITLAETVIGLIILCLVKVIVMFICFSDVIANTSCLIFMAFITYIEIVFLKNRTFYRKEVLLKKDKFLFVPIVVSNLTIILAIMGIDAEMLSSVYVVVFLIIVFYGVFFRYKGYYIVRNEKIDIELKNGTIINEIDTSMLHKDKKFFVLKKDDVLYKIFYSDIVSIRHYGNMKIEERK